MRQSLLSSTAQRAARNASKSNHRGIILSSLGLLVLFTASFLIVVYQSPRWSFSGLSHSSSSTQHWSSSGSGRPKTFDDRVELSKERVHSVAQNGYLMVTWANHHYTDFVLSWVEHVRSCGMTSYMVGAMDHEILATLANRSINTFRIGANLTLGDFGWGTPTFAKMGRFKIRLIRTFLQLDVSVIISDVDTVWLRNPIPFFERFPDADILTSSDHLSNTVMTEALEKFPEAASAANIGVMMFRKKSIPFVEDWIQLIESDETIWDQNAFNDLFRRGLQILPNDPHNYFMGDNGKLKMGILPVALFASGHTFFIQHLASKLALQPYAVHATFQFSGTPGKRHRMREALLWHDPPEYYNHPGGFMTFLMDRPHAMLKNSPPNTGKMELPNVVGHFTLMNHQILQVRNALAIASVMGRAVIIPQLMCGQDRFWAPHPGVIPGSHLDLPFNCPLDHVFDLEHGMAKQLDEVHFGPHIPFRESSFLSNPRLPKNISDSRAVVHVCDEQDAASDACSDGSKPAAVEMKDGKPHVWIKPNLKSAQLQVALSNLRDYQVLEFSTMLKAFGNFTDPLDYEKFFRRTTIYTSIWCCVDLHPGHIHYDMWWDIPHKDKFNRDYAQWELRAGP